MAKGFHAAESPVYRNAAPDLQECFDAVAEGIREATHGGTGVKRAVNATGNAASTVYALGYGDDIPSLRQLLLIQSSALGNPEKTREQALAPLIGLCRVFSLDATPRLAVEHEPSERLLLGAASSLSTAASRLLLILGGGVELNGESVDELEGLLRTLRQAEQRITAAIERAERKESVA